MMAEEEEEGYKAVAARATAPILPPQPEPEGCHHHTTPHPQDDRLAKKGASIFVIEQKNKKDFPPCIRV
jgi:hypothetical protein